MKPKLETLARVIYLLGFPAAWFIGNTFGRADRFGSHSQAIMPMFIGLIFLLPFILLLGWTRRIAPRTTPILVAAHGLVLALLLVPPLSIYVLFLLFPLFLVSIFVSQKEARLVFEAWFHSNNYVTVPDPPAAVWDKLDRHKAWRCYANTFRLADGRNIPYLLWEGIGSTTTMVSAGGSNTPVSAKAGLIAFSFPPGAVGEDFMREIESQHLNKLGFWPGLKPSSQRKCPCTVERLPDGAFVAAWQCQHIAHLVEERVQFLRALSEKYRP